MIQTIQKWMEKAYRLSPAPPAGKFFIDHGELSQFLGPDHPLIDSEEVVLLMRQDEDYSLGLYLKEALRVPPKGKIQGLTYHQLANLIEGVSHLLLLMNRCHARQEITMLELELQAEIDKFLFFRLSPVDGFRHHARDHLEKKANLKNLDKERKNTYETARRLANRYCRHLEKTYLALRSVGPLWEELRQFYRMTHWKKLQTVGLP